jgi:hypothetical protein
LRLPVAGYGYGYGYGYGCLRHARLALRILLPSFGQPTTTDLPTCATPGSLSSTMVCGTAVAEPPESRWRSVREPLESR